MRNRKLIVQTALTRPGRESSELLTSRVWALPWTARCRMSRESHGSNQSIPSFGQALLIRTHSLVLSESRMRSDAEGALRRRFRVHRSEVFPRTRKTKRSCACDCGRGPVSVGSFFLLLLFFSLFLLSSSLTQNRALKLRFL